MRISLLALVVFVFSHTLCAADFEKKLAPFTTDGCSMFFDGNWRECCAVHDIAYWKGGTEFEKKASDQALSDCVAKKSFLGKSLGKSMQVGVYFGGSPALPDSWRWGYGWNYSRPYGSLDTEEQRQVDRYLPLTFLPFQYRVRPITTGVINKIFLDKELKSLDSEFKSLFSFTPDQVTWVRLREDNSFQVFSETCPGGYWVVEVEKY